MQENLLITSDKNSIISTKTLNTNTNNDKADQSTEKYFSYTKTKIPDNSQSLDNHLDYLGQQNCDKLFDIFQNLCKVNPNKVEIVNNIISSFDQFTAAQLLQKSSSPLWKPTKADKILTSYCKTLTSLCDKNLQLTMISSCQQQYIGIKIGKKNSEVYIFEAEPMAIQFFQQRSQFLQNFKKKLGSNYQENKISELSKEIVFLYSEYKKLRKRILEMVEEKKKVVQKDLIQQLAEQKLKKMTKQLKQLRKYKSRKGLRKKE